MSRMGFAFLPFLCLTASLFSCTGKEVHHNYFVYAYGTYWDIHLYEGNDADCAELADFVVSSSRLFDTTDLGEAPSGLNALNKTHDYVQVDPLVREALQKAIAYEEETGGAFNYHVGELTSLWISALEKGEVLSDEVREDALTKAKATRAEINGDSVRRIGEGIIDLNAMSKGFCCSKIKEKLEAKGFTKYFVNAGSSSLLIGENHSSDGTMKVGLSDAEGRYFKTKNAAVSCSSVSRQSYEIGGATYSHIVDPFTGKAKAKYQAVYLCGDDACDLDAYSTAAMVSDLGFASILEGKGISYAYVEKGTVTYESEGFLA